MSCKELISDQADEERPDDCDFKAMEGDIKELKKNKDISAGEKKVRPLVISRLLVASVSWHLSQISILLTSNVVRFL